MLNILLNIGSAAFLAIVIGLVDAFMRTAAERYNSDV